MIEIDGSYGVGGGQIIRTALALSTITGKSFKVDKIRLSRPEPGLKNQHLSCIDALINLSDARVCNAEHKNTSFEFTPGKINPQTLSIDIGTAGAITLVLQSILLPCCLGPGKVRLKIKGGTENKWAMPLDNLINVILPYYSLFADFKINEIKRGFYPKGQGFIDINIKPKFGFGHTPSNEPVFDEGAIKIDLTHVLAEIKTQVKPIDLVRKVSIAKIKGTSVVSTELRSAEVAERQAKGAKKKLSSLNIPVKIDLEYVQTAFIGTSISLWAVPEDSSQPISLSSDNLGERNKRAEAVGAEAASNLLYLLCSDAVVDSHLADNLIPILAIAGGQIRTSEITGHILSNIYVCEQFLDVKFEIDKEKCIIRKIN